MAKFGDAISKALRYTSRVNRNTIDPEQCGERPCIRAMRNEACERLLKSDGKYRFPIDMASLKSE